VLFGPEHNPRQAKSNVVPQPERRIGVKPEFSIRKKFRCSCGIKEIGFET